MDSLRDIEAGLERLMPRGLSEDSRVELESVIDEFCLSAEPTVSFWRKPYLWTSAVAAVVLLGAGGMFANKGPGQNAVAVLEASDAHFHSSGISVLEKRTWIDSGEDLGIQSLNEFGETRRGWSYSGVEEERVLHEDSGYEVILQREFDAELYAASSL
ncbi:hypothetical protein [Roseibacillus persicicus]|uniref:hypothetical protein n=1 Tax=Roseibacillus persicicus TaxID=454148 RepID=UPI00280CCFE8|nr:hypothetical protein [Roseibacillus persicicus]MDQ8191922.1 hypothetical protein [Roseibacillus persicicus]